MRFRLFAPVLLLTTGACFATRNDVRILQDDIQRSRDSTEARMRGMESRFAARFDSMNRNLSRFLDSTIKTLNEQMNNTGGNLTTGQRSLETKFETILATMQTVTTELKRQSDEQALMREQVEGLVTAFIMRDTAGGPPPDGPVAKLLAGKRMLEQSSFVTAQNLFIEVISEATDTTVLADAHRGLGDAYLADGKRAEADSVFQLLYEKYPASEHAPYALLKYGLSLLTDRKLDEARTILQRVIDGYPTSTEATMARERIPPPQH